MGLSIKQKIDKINKVYPGWRLALQQMTARQVCAIYDNMDKKGKFEKKPRNENLSLLPKDPYDNYVQMTIFDFMKEEDYVKST